MDQPSSCRSGDLQGYIDSLSDLERQQFFAGVEKCKEKRKLVDCQLAAQNFAPQNKEVLGAYITGAEAPGLAVQNTELAEHVGENVVSTRSPAPTADQNKGKERNRKSPPSDPSVHDSGLSIGRVSDNRAHILTNNHPEPNPASEAKAPESGSDSGLVPEPEDNLLEIDSRVTKMTALEREIYEMQKRLEISFAARKQKRKYEQAIGVIVESAHLSAPLDRPSAPNADRYARIPNYTAEYMLSATKPNGLIQPLGPLSIDSTPSSKSLAKKSRTDGGVETDHSRVVDMEVGAGSSQTNNEPRTGLDELDKPRRYKSYTHLSPKDYTCGLFNEITGRRCQKRFSSRGIKQHQTMKHGFYQNARPLPNSHPAEGEASKNSSATLKHHDSSKNALPNSDTAEEAEAPRDSSPPSGDRITKVNDPQTCRRIHPRTGKPCNKPFEREWSYYHHLVQVHGEETITARKQREAMESNVEPQHVCELIHPRTGEPCNTPFKTAANLYRHRVVVHKVERIGARKAREAKEARETEGGG